MILLLGVICGLTNPLAKTIPTIVLQYNLHLYVHYADIYTALDRRLLIEQRWFKLGVSNVLGAECM